MINISVEPDWPRAGALPLLFRPVAAVTPEPKALRPSLALTACSLWRRLNYCDAGLNQRGQRGAQSAGLKTLARISSL